MMKMKLLFTIVAIRIIGIHSALNFSVLNNDEPLTRATIRIVDTCFTSFEHWPEVLVVPEHGYHKIVEEIHHDLKTTISIESPDTPESNKSMEVEQFSDHSNTRVQWHESKPTAVIITTHSLKQLEFILTSLKTDVQRIWRPESYFLIVLETRCNVTELNDMFKVIWDYWILNAVILCSSNNNASRNQGEIELYTFNPYSADHPATWKTIIHETIEVSINPGNFNHSWYIFTQGYTGIRSFRKCGDLFFEKTSNLDGYTIPISFNHRNYLSNNTESLVTTIFGADAPTLKTIAKHLRFDFAQIADYDDKSYGRLLKNGSLTGLLLDLSNGRSHIAPNKRGVRFYPGLGMTYPHELTAACFASWITGNRPQWSNLADAKVIWMGIGFGVICFTVFLYLQSKSHGIVSAFLDAERLVIGSTIIRSPTVIKHRIILGSILLVILVFDGAFRGRFISILTIARPYPNLDSLDQIKGQDVGVYGHSAFKEMIMDPQIREILNSSLEFPTCLDSLQSRKSQRVCFSDCGHLQRLSMNLSDIHIARTPIWTTYTTFLTTMHWPLKDRYSTEVQKLVESGISEKWKSDVNRNFEVNAWKLRRAEELPFVRAIKLNDILPAFVLLFMGLSSALIVFVWEIRGPKPEPS